MENLLRQVPSVGQFLIPCGNVVSYLHMKFKQGFENTGQSQEFIKPLELEIVHLRETPEFKKYAHFLSLPSADRTHEDVADQETAADALITILKEEKGRTEDITHTQLREIVLKITAPSN